MCKCHKSCASLLAFAAVSRCAVDGNLRRDTLHSIDSTGGSLGGVRFFFLVFVFTSFILGNIVQYILLQDAHDQVKPEEIDGLKTGKKSKGDVLADPAFVLLSLPVQLEGTDGSEFGQNCPEDLQVDKMPQVNPDRDEEAEIRSNNR